ncbi:hypothetical protein GH714_036480 [Hevea brasiliensis]|uniref:Uncharacterized protein n=1 Tax=Hevea brasiliensis TaxID=3981 RepID=A0A6A6NET6_HEVBR|nr:hypothetical protein GH714_036480 [Hevea brasiliensis]
MNRGRASSSGGYSNPRGRSSRSAGHSSYRGRHMDGADGACYDSSFSRRDGTSHGRRGSTNSKVPTQVYLPKKPSGDGTIHSEVLQQDQNASNASGSESKQLESFEAFDSASEGSSALSSACSSSQDNVVNIQAGQVLTEGAVKEGTLHHDLSSKLNISTQQNQSLPSLNSGAKDQPSQQQCAKSTECNRESEHSEHRTLIETFDIFLPRTGTPVILKPSLLAKTEKSGMRSSELPN